MFSDCFSLFLTTHLQVFSHPLPGPVFHCHPGRIRQDWLKNGQERINGGVILARNSKWSEDMLPVPGWERKWPGWGANGTN